MEHIKAIDFASEARPVWNMAISDLIRGYTPDQALAAMKSVIAQPSERLGQLHAAVPVIASLR